MDGYGLGALIASCVAAATGIAVVMRDSRSTPKPRWSELEVNWNGFTGDSTPDEYGNVHDRLRCMFRNVGNAPAFQAHAEGVGLEVAPHDWAKIDSGDPVEMNVRFAGALEGAIVFTWRHPPDWETVHRKTIELRQPPEHRA